MRRLPTLFAALAAAIALAGAAGCSDDDAGGTTQAPPATSAGTATAPTPPPSPATTQTATAPAGELSLTDRLCERPGSKPEPVATPTTSVDEFASTGSLGDDADAFRAAYRENGFEEGLFQRMAPDPSGRTGGLCIVIRFAEEAGATANVAFEVAQQVTFAQRDGYPFEPFAVPGIPGAQGFQLGPDGGDQGHNVLFADGRHTYLVGQGGTNPPETQRDDVIAAAQALYERVKGK